MYSLYISAPLWNTSLLIFILGFLVGDRVAGGGANLRNTRSLEALNMSAQDWGADGWGNSVELGLDSNGGAAAPSIPFGVVGDCSWTVGTVEKVDLGFWNLKSEFCWGWIWFTTDGASAVEIAEEKGSTVQAVTWRRFKPELEPIISEDWEKEEPVRRGISGGNCSRSGDPVIGKVADWSYRWWQRRSIWKFWRASNSLFFFLTVLEILYGYLFYFYFFHQNLFESVYLFNFNLILYHFFRYIFNLIRIDLIRLYVS